MPDTSRDREPRMPPASWHDAFATLSSEVPASDAWQGIARSLDSARPGRRRRPLAWLALAAVLALAIALPWRAVERPVDGPADRSATGDLATATATKSGLDALYAESAQLEILLAHARDSQVASGTALAMTDDLDARLAAIDSRLSRPGLDAQQQQQLWTDRVQALRTLVAFEGTRRWLAANGTHYDGALVHVN